MSRKKKLSFQQIKVLLDVISESFFYNYLMTLLLTFFIGIPQADRFLLKSLNYSKFFSLQITSNLS